MEETIKSFEKRAMDMVSEFRNLLGAKSITMSVHIDNYEKGCKTDVTFLTSFGVDPSCGTACKVD